MEVEAAPQGVIHYQKKNLLLKKVVHKYGIFSWKYLYELNKDAIGDNPDLLAVGTVLTIPGFESTIGVKYTGQIRTAGI